jgi:16S rRNA (adenine1518-N6/adenine1519-N6)-dimethyltransferase
MKAKKYLGQNFLTSKKFIDDVIRTAKISSEDTIVEIGPGKGALTKPLLTEAKRVIAIEKDETLIEQLKEKFANEMQDERFTLIEGDALGVGIEKLTNERYSIVANIPYYITGMILRHFLSAKTQPKSMTLIMQKEVAERLVSRDGKESVLSLSVAAFGKAHYIEKIPARYFAPKPKVDSAIVHIDNISRDFFSDINEGEFFRFIKCGFGHKRKKLLSNLSVLYPRDTLSRAFASCNVSENQRAEELALPLWKKLLLRVTE